MQQAEVLGDQNRWFCAQFHGREISCAELLWRYFIHSGGATCFARRWTMAMSDDNRWYCGEFYGYKVTDEEMLWEYFMTYGMGSTNAGSRQLVTSNER